ncbi:MAG: NlpC/P60 family protein [Sulfurimonas sp.]|nr:NlpC/P60 family protein [Sulfurimonas sp.]MDD3060969.1 NlpC/P60 family protein [Sulfurimonas sp.]MDD5203081.1 NlpC/P60 family protein [Sulfurimonas sp.]
MRRVTFLRFIPLVIFPLVLLFSGCAQKQPVIEAPAVIMEPIKIDPIVDKEGELRKTIVANALKYLNTKDGRDCSGFVAMVNLENGEPYYKARELEQYFTNTNRSKAIYNAMKAETRVAKNKPPKIGDLVFFSDTLQTTKRKVGAANITHVGIVTNIDEDETVHFIHHSRGKNVMGALNLQFPQAAQLEGKNINTYMKECDSRKRKQECLSPYFLSAYGAVENSF